MSNEINVAIFIMGLIQLVSLIVMAKIFTINKKQRETLTKLLNLKTSDLDYITLFEEDDGIIKTIKELYNNIKSLNTEFTNETWHMKNKLNKLYFESNREVKSKEEIKKYIEDAYIKLDCFDYIKIHPYYIKYIKDSYDKVDTIFDNMPYVLRYDYKSEEEVREMTNDSDFIYELTSRDNLSHTSSYYINHKDKMIQVKFLNWESEYDIIIEDGVLKY